MVRRLSSFVCFCRSAFLVGNLFMMLKLFLVFGNCLPIFSLRLVPEQQVADHGESESAPAPFEFLSVGSHTEPRLGLVKPPWSPLLNLIPKAPYQAPR